MQASPHEESGGRGDYDDCDRKRAHARGVILLLALVWAELRSAWMAEGGRPWVAVRAALYLASSGEAVVKRFFRGVVKAVAIIAGAVFFFDNHLSGTAGLVLLGSIAVLFLCLFVWMIFLREDDDDGDGGIGRLARAREV